MIQRFTPSAYRWTRPASRRPRQAPPRGRRFSALNNPMSTDAAPAPLLSRHTLHFRKPSKVIGQDTACRVCWQRGEEESMSINVTEIILAASLLGLAVGFAVL
jgi:hypothetical protein